MAITDFYEELKIMERRTESDGLGGFYEDLIEGAPFMGAITTNLSTESRIAEQQGVKSLYTFTTGDNVPVKYGDIIKRGNEYFRIASDPNDMVAPKGMGYKQAKAERYTI